MIELILALVYSGFAICIGIMVWLEYDSIGIAGIYFIIAGIFYPLLIWSFNALGEYFIVLWLIVLGIFLIFWDIHKATKEYLEQLKWEKTLSFHKEEREKREVEK